MKFLADIEVEEGLKDSDGDLGSNGQVLSSTGSGTDWIDAAGTIGGSIADNQIAVGASTTNNIEGSSDFTYTGSVFTVEGRMVLSDNLTATAPNIYIGKDAGINSALTGSPLPTNNIGIGRRALQQLTDGGSNIAIGAGALRATTENGANIGIGGNTLFYLDGTGGSSSYNTVIGHSSGERYGASFTDGDYVTTGSDNVFVGWRTRPLANNPQNQIIIGYDTVGGGDNTITLGNGDITTFRIPGLNATNNQVLTYNATAGGFKAAAAAGGGIGGSTTATEIAFGSATSSEITSSAEATFVESAGKTLLQVGSTGGKAQSIININQTNNDTSRARLELSRNTSTRGFLGIEYASTDVTLYSNDNLVLESDGDDVIITTQTASKVGIGNTSPTEKLDVTGRIKASAGVQVGAELDSAAGSGTVGMLRYRTYSDASFDYSATDVCMQDGPGAGDYEWINIVTKRW